ncbi:hypothetical protein AAC387_Pa02g1784 [Persea americana]
MEREERKQWEREREQGREGGREKGRIGTWPLLVQARASGRCWSRLEARRERKGEGRERIVGEGEGGNGGEEKDPPPSRAGAGGCCRSRPASEVMGRWGDKKEEGGKNVTS